MNTAYRHIGVETESGVLVLSIIETRMDDYDLCDAIRHELVDAATKADDRAVVIDLGKIEFIASVGIMPFLSVNRSVRHQNGRLVLCNFSDFVEQVFTSTRLLINPSSLHSPFQWAATRKDAIKALQD